jgi:hypothetical protein
MNQGFVNNVIKAIFKILENIKIKKKSNTNTMPDNQQPIPAQPVQPSTTTLGANTIVQFTLKGFIATIMTIMGIFASFYFMVFEPRADNVEQYQKELMDKQKEEFDKEFKAMNAGIAANGKGVLDLTKRFNDLNEAIEEIGNSSGGFGGSSAMSSHTSEPAIDPTRVAENHQ